MKLEEFYKDILNGVNDGIYFVDNNRKITFWNKSAEKITGFKSDEVIGSYCFNNILNHIDECGTELCKDGCPLHKTLEDGIKRDSTIYFHHKDGYRVETHIHVTPIFENGEIIGAVESFNTDNEKINIFKDNEKLKVLAYKDQLTQLPNRRYIDDKMEMALAEYKKMKIPFGVAILDIDHFKYFNDTYGHDIGDLVLQMIAKVFIGITRSSDLIGRWGGEEFIAVFTNVNEELYFKSLDRLRVLVEKSSLRYLEKDLKVTISIGATISKPEDSLESLFKRADEMLYKSKENGRNQVTLI